MVERSVTTGTGRRRLFASRQGRRTRIRNRTNTGPAPFQGVWSCRGVSGGYASLRHRLISIAPPALEEFASSIARDRFGSHLRILQTPERGDAMGFLSIIAAILKCTIKAVPSAGALKDAAILCG